MSGDVTIPYDIAEGNRYDGGFLKQIESDGKSEFFLYNNILPIGILLPTIYNIMTCSLDPWSSAAA